MVEGKWTPGPWQTHDDYVPGCLMIIANVDGEIIDGTTHHTYDFVASCVDEYGEFSADAVANARLIAAAPDLVKALETAIGWFEQYADEHYAKAKTAPDGREQHSREVKGKTNRDRAKLLRAALARAKGPSHD